MTLEAVGACFYSAGQLTTYVGTPSGHCKAYALAVYTLRRHTWALNISLTYWNRPRCLPVHICRPSEIGPVLPADGRWFHGSVEVLAIEAPLGTVRTRENYQNRVQIICLTR